MKEYIHYGHKEFNIDSFNQIKNEYLWVKPMGGLWASATDSEYGWKQWCESNDFREYTDDNSFKFTLTENANVYHIYSVKDLEKLPKVVLPPDDSILTINKYIIDFEDALKSGYDAIELHLSEEIDKPDGFTTGLYYTLYGWDCDSIIVMNPEIIIPI